MDTSREGVLDLRIVQQTNHVGHVVGNRGLAGLNRARTKSAASVRLIFRPGLDIRESRRCVVSEDRFWNSKVSWQMPKVAESVGVDGFLEDSVALLDFCPRGAVGVVIEVHSRGLAVPMGGICCKISLEAVWR